MQRGSRVAAVVCALGLGWALALGPVAGAAAPALPGTGPFRPGPPGALGSALQAQSLAASSNWAGFIDGVVANPATGGLMTTGQTFTSVRGAWRVPRLQPPPHGVEATWIGLGGVSGALLQVGTVELWGPHPLYEAFWEVVGGAGSVSAQPIALVHAGDRVAASVAQVPGTSRWALNLSVNGQPLSIDTALAGGSGNELPFAAASTAEWIVEDPACSVSPSLQLCPLADFAPETFHSAATNAGTVFQAPWTDSVLVAADGRPEVAVVSPQVGEITASTPPTFTLARLSAPRPQGPQPEPGGQPGSGPHPGHGPQGGPAPGTRPGPLAPPAGPSGPAPGR